MKNKISQNEIYADKFYNYYSDDNYELFDVQEFYYPYYKVKCNCIFREKSKISKVEEVFLKALSLGINDFKSIEKFLGLDKEIFEEIAAKMHIDGMFVETPLLQLTQQGKKILEFGAKLESIENEETITLDAITGIALNEDKKNITFDRKKANYFKEQILYPKNETLDRLIGNKALQTILYEEIKKKDTKEKEIYEIKEIVGNPFKKYEKYFVLFYKNDSDNKKILILKNGQPDDEVTQLVSELEKEGKDIFDFSNEKENKNKFEKVSIYEYSQIENLKTGTSLGTYEHPKFFNYLFKHSQKEIFVISPWIRWEIIKDKEDDIKKALEKGVEITFFYSMGKDEDIDKKSKEFFENLCKKYSKKFKFMKNSTSDHSKVIICDREWMVISSFNWASFKGDENREKRDETGTFINDKDEILKMINSKLNTTQN